MLQSMARIWILLAAGVVLFAGAIHTASEYALMVRTAEYNSAPSGIALLFMIPYGVVAAVLVAIWGVSAHRARSGR